MAYSVYLFDFDYTLADAEAAIIKCYRTVILRNGHPDVPDDDIRRGIGKGIMEIFSSLTGVTDEAVLARYSEEYISEADLFMSDNTFLYPEVIPVLCELQARGKMLGIVSNKLSRRIMETIVKYDIESLFDVVIGSEDTTALKPKPDGIFSAISRLGVDKQDVLYVGDSLIDAETAKNAGVSFAAVTTGATEPDEFKPFPRVMIMTGLSGLL